MIYIRLHEYQICGGVISDTWEAEERGMAMGLYTLAPFLGPSIGPIAGAWVAEKSTWRWVFWATSTFAGLVQVLGFLYLKESACVGFAISEISDHPRLQHIHRSC